MYITVISMFLQRMNKNPNGISCRFNLDLRKGKLPKT